MWACTDAKLEGKSFLGMLNLCMAVFLTWLLLVPVWLSGHTNFSALAPVTGYVCEFMADSSSIEENLFLAYANSAHLVSVKDKKSQEFSKVMKLKGGLVTDLYSAKSLMERKKGVAIRFLQWADMLTFSCLYNEVWHKERSPRRLYILLEPCLEMNKLIFAWQVAELKYVCNFCQKKCPVSFRDPRNEQKFCILHISYACLSGCLASIKTSQRIFHGCLPKSWKVAQTIQPLVSDLVD